MKRKDYITLARALVAYHRGDIPRDTDGGQADKFGFYQPELFIADELGNDSPQFDREHFLAVVRGEKALTSKPPRRRALGGVRA